MAGAQLAHLITAMQPDTERHDSLELLRMLRGLRAPSQKPEPGFKSTNQWAKEWGMCRAKASKYINVARAAGLLTERIYKIADHKGRLRIVPHYKIDKAPPSAT